MRAALFTCYGDNSVVGCGEVFDPTPGLDEALIEVRAAGTNQEVRFTTDGEIELGAWLFQPGAISTPRPAITMAHGSLVAWLAESRWR